METYTQGRAVARRRHDPKYSPPMTKAPKLNYWQLMYIQRKYGERLASGEVVTKPVRRALAKERIKNFAQELNSGVDDGPAAIEFKARMAKLIAKLK